MSKHTPGPWEWFMHSGERPYLATPDRGRLYVMDFGRKGMQGATPRFAVWQGIYEGAERARLGGYLQDGPLLKDGSVHPDARLMAASPDLLDAAQSAVHVLFLLEREVNALGFRAGNVREKLSAAIRKAGADDGRWNERLAEARSDLCDAIQELKGE